MSRARHAPQSPLRYASIVDRSLICWLSPPHAIHCLNKTAAIILPHGAATQSARPPPTHVRTTASLLREHETRPTLRATNLLKQRICISTRSAQIGVTELALSSAIKRPEIYVLLCCFPWRYGCPHPFTPRVLASPPRLHIIYSVRSLHFTLLPLTRMDTRHLHPRSPRVGRHRSSSSSRRPRWS